MSRATPGASHPFEPRAVGHRHLDHPPLGHFRAHVLRAATLLAPALFDFRAIGLLIHAARLQPRLAWQAFQMRDLLAQRAILRPQPRVLSQDLEPQLLEVLERQGIKIWGRLGHAPNRIELRVANQP